MEAEEGTITACCPTFHKAIVALRESWVSKNSVTELEMILSLKWNLSGEEFWTWKLFTAFLEDDEDVQKIYTNVDDFLLENEQFY